MSGTVDPDWKGERTRGSASSKCHLLKQNGVSDRDNLWNGESIGHWEGDTLVVETTGFNERTWIDAAGVPHSSGMKVIEHIRLLDANNMEIVSTVHDPKMYSEDWSFTTHPKKLDGEILEYICNENEKDSAHLVGK